MKDEPVPLFKQGEFAYYGDDREPVTVLTINTYCKCCDRFLDGANYSIKFHDGEVKHKVPESDLHFLMDLLDRFNRSVEILEEDKPDTKTFINGRRDFT